MGRNTPIEWCDHSWPVVNGCRRCSPGCEHCYAERLIATRLRHMPKYKGLAIYNEFGPKWSGESRLWPSDLDAPLRAKKPGKIFVADMGDLFYEQVTNEEIAAVFGVMMACPHHTFQVLTKRAKRMRKWFEEVPINVIDYIRDAAEDVFAKQHYDMTAANRRAIAAGHRAMRGQKGWPLPNVWLGVSVENQEYAEKRIPELLTTPAATRFVSYEPALGPVDFYAYLKSELRDQCLTELKSATLPGLDWIICGGESGIGARPFDIGWATAVRDQCEKAGVAFFLKQLGKHPQIDGIDVAYDPSVDAWQPGKLVSKKGSDWDEWPERLRVRQFPKAA